MNLMRPVQIINGLAATGFLPSAIKNGREEAYHAIAGFTFVISIISLAAYFIPSDWNKWIRYDGAQMINLLLFLFFAYR